MQTVVLPGTDLTPSRLGFGSAPLMARLGRRESVRLLEVAHESGITHFDTARAYGYGEAESAVGEFLSRRRDGVTVTTKLGIVPPRRSAGLQAAKSVARVVTRVAPGVRRVLRRGAVAMSQTSAFAPAEARASLETSLRELGTDVIDILLLHECTPEDVETEGLLELLEDAVREGKVRYFGIATDGDSTRTILERRPELAGVVQIPDNAVDRTRERLPALNGRAVITHSTMRTVAEPLAELMRHPERRERWSQAVGADCSRADVRGRLLMACALEANRDGVVLFASTDEERIRSNAALAAGEEFSPTQTREFARLVGEALAQGSVGA
jgi:D-threo-aldose 1-dehydrogenase